MEPFKTHRGIVAALDRANIDTDQIIPKQFLKSIQRAGFGEGLFFDWRFLSDARPNPSFILNQDPFRGASILVVRNNFGCGSSREHAVWALKQFGIRAVIAPWESRGGARLPAFADIFKNNAAKNALLTIELSSGEVETIFHLVKELPGLEATVDLGGGNITFHVPEREVSFHFEIPSAVKERLLYGLDDIACTLKHENKIAVFEARHNVQKHS